MEAPFIPDQVIQLKALTHFPTSHQHSQRETVEGSAQEDNLWLKAYASNILDRVYAWMLII